MTYIYEDNVSMFKRVYARYGLDISCGALPASLRRDLKSDIDAKYVDPDESDGALYDAYKSRFFPGYRVGWHNAHGGGKFCVIEEDRDANYMQLERYALDGLCSWRKLFDIYEGAGVWISKYELMRSTWQGNLLWPKHRSNINALRGSSGHFNDCIDYTLHDIKLYYSCTGDPQERAKKIKAVCELHEGYLFRDKNRDRMPTMEYLDSFESFEDFCKTTGLDGCFTIPSNTGGLDVRDLHGNPDEPFDPEEHGNAVFDLGYWENVEAMLREHGEPLPAC